MATWNSAYNLSPKNFKNPGEGAFHFRDLKGAINERGVRDHFWGDDEDSDNFWYGGVHKEGSGKITVTDGGSANRDDGRVASASAAIGQMQVDMMPLGINREQNGEELQTLGTMDYTDQLVKKLVVTGQQFDGTTGAWVTPTDPTVTEVFDLFDYDRMMDIVQDQDVKGIKRFTHSPHVPNLADVGAPSVLEGWKDYLDTPPATDGSGLSPVNITEAYATVSASKVFNIFDSENDDNDTQEDLNSPTNKVVLDTIEAVRIHGTVITGAVYG